MRKVSILVAILALVSVGAFAQQSRFPGSIGAGTTLNDDSCDIGVAPAATLLLPYFEVGLGPDSTVEPNTFFTITNTSRLPQIAHITVWTDWSVPILDFNIFLTGYDVQSLSMYDVITRGVVPATSIDRNGNGVINAADSGPRSALNTANPAFFASVSTDCLNQGGNIPPALAAEVRDALTGLSYDFTNAQNIPTGCVVGNAHANAIGYVTVDVARTCSTTLPTDPTYYSPTGDIAHDNVLIGDYFHIGPDAATGNFAGGNTMVHIRAIPEGTLVPVVDADVTFPYTFYDRYTTVAESGGDRADRRQPLPGLWAARYVEDVLGANTEYRIWREGVTEGAPTCTGAERASLNASVPLTEIVRFDESENPNIGATGVCTFSPCPVEAGVSFPETGSFATDGARFPADTTVTADPGGWMYLNLNHAEQTGRNITSNWVNINITADGRFSVDYDAAWLGNGCTPNPGITTTDAINPIGPQ